MKKVLIIGGGLGGLTAAIVLGRKGADVTLMEKKKYPFHRVCGEYVSNETVPFLESVECFPSLFKPPVIKRFQLSSVNGKTVEIPLGLGGFGISRYTFDNYLSDRARSFGACVLENCEVESVKFEKGLFEVKTPAQTYSADLVIGAHGKRSRLDASLKRNFIEYRSPYVGVKYHIRYDIPEDLIALHNFENGYCGISKVENGACNLCYLSHQSNFAKHKSIRSVEEAVLFRNPLLKSIFKRAEFLLDKPETISEITFEIKEAVYNHILMVGDSAGMITPLCGNGMAMAIHSGKIAGELAGRFCRNESYSRADLERDYSREWTLRFARRLWVGRQIQKMFGSVKTSEFAVMLGRSARPVAQWLAGKTHGKPF